MTRHSGSQRIAAVGLAAGLVGWSFVGPRISARARVPLQAGLGGLLVVASRRPLGLRPPQLWAGVRLGVTAGAVAAAAVLAATSVPAVRLSMARRELPSSPSAWLAVQIPLGTVWSEEATFRAALATVAGRAYGGFGGRLLQSVAFGLSHIADARSTEQPVFPVVLGTAAAGWVFGWLAETSGSLTAPMLTHLAINESAAAAALAIQFRTSRR